MNILSHLFVRSVTRSLSSRFSRSWSKTLILKLIPRFGQQPCSSFFVLRNPGLQGASSFGVCGQANVGLSALGAAARRRIKKTTMEPRYHSTSQRRHDSLCSQHNGPRDTRDIARCAFHAFIPSTVIRNCTAGIGITDPEYHPRVVYLCTGYSELYSTTRRS